MMFRNNISIGRIFGISIDLDYSWFLIVALLTWVLASNYFPFEFKNWPTYEYWFVGAFTAIMLFVSVLIHELGHSIVAKRYGISVPRITLFIFGGVSQIADEPTSAAAEFWIAIVGPIVSFALAALFWELEPLVAFSPPLLAIAKYLALINFVLGFFNLIPGFPLDGGRVLRAFLWRVTGKSQQATRIAAATGRFFGFALIFLGVWQALSGSFFNGLWIAFIGWFLESAAGSQFQQDLMKRLIADHRVGEAMTHDLPQIPGNVTVQDLVDKHVLTRGLRCFVVTGGNHPVGMVTLSRIRETPRAGWPTTTVSQIMIPLEKLATVRPEAGLWSALQKMGRDGVNQLPVVGGDGIVGMLSREDVVHYLQALQALHA
jgi:Zn-dependent protease/CBS domain-containing protein